MTHPQVSDQIRLSIHYFNKWMMNLNNNSNNKPKTQIPHIIKKSSTPLLFHLFSDC